LLSRNILTERAEKVSNLVDSHLQRLQQEIAAAIDGLSCEQLKRHPPGKWCVGEVLEHLYLTYTGTLKGFERVNEGGKRLATGQTWKQRARTLIVVALGYLPSGREAPPVARPRGSPPEKVLAEIGLKIAEMDERIASCEQKLGSRRKLLDHPILGPLTAAQWRKFHLVHGLHHVKQIRRLRESAITAADKK
jgi:DinB superfamily